MNVNNEVRNKLIKWKKQQNQMNANKEIKKQIKHNE